VSGVEEKAVQSERLEVEETGQRSTLQLVRDIAGDTATLVRKEVELAKQEITEAITARIKAAAALAVAGVMGFFVVFFGAFGVAEGLAHTVQRWLAFLIVAAGFLLVAGGAAFFGLQHLKKPPLAPEETKRTVKEDVEWAKAQLKR
jgi:cytochrome c biogenesis protein CcdA